MIDESDDVTTWRFHRMSAVAMGGSLLLHATALAALLPETLPRQERLSEQTIELTLERPTAPPEAPAVPAAEQAAQRLPSGSSDFAPAALAPGPSEAASAPLPAPAEPHLARTLPSAEPPPEPAKRDFGTSAAPPGPQPQSAGAMSWQFRPQVGTGADKTSACSDSLLTLDSWFAVEHRSSQRRLRTIRDEGASSSTPRARAWRPASPARSHPCRAARASVW